MRLTRDACEPSQPEDFKIDSAKSNSTKKLQSLLAAESSKGVRSRAPPIYGPSTKKKKKKKKKKKRPKI
jgi:hypothetical protein